MLFKNGSFLAVLVGWYFTLTYFPGSEKKAYSLFACTTNHFERFHSYSNGDSAGSMNHIPPLKAAIMLMKLKVQKSANAIFIFTANTSSPTVSKSMFRSFSQIITISLTLCYLMAIFYSIMFNSFMHYSSEIRATYFIRLCC